jgi:hypothetical protein
MPLHRQDLSLGLGWQLAALSPGAVHYWSAVRWPTQRASWILSHLAFQDAGRLPGDVDGAIHVPSLQTTLVPETAQPVAEPAHVCWVCWGQTLRV